MRPLPLLLALTLLAPALADEPTPQGLVAHEWGTFTTVSGGSGAALDWRPLSGPSDLPRFVHTNRQKSGWRGKVRMETPVIYFYSDRKRTVRARVAFAEGTITEWYPWARPASGAGVDWGRFAVIPPDAPEAADLQLPREDAPSHYYPAREVDAAFVRSCADGGRAEVDRFLFYRGVGNVSLPLQVTVTPKGELVIANASPHPVAQAFVFQREGDALRLGAVGQVAAKAPLRVQPGVLPRVEAREVEQTLARALVESGLYPREAQAMLATWRDHWFEEGVRVFYLVPRPVTDRVLPLTLEPAPDELVRTIVGRVEAITPAYSQRLLELARRWRQTQDPRLRDELRRQGRFAEPALEQLVVAGELAPETALELTRR